MKKGLVISGSILSGICLIVAAVTFFSAMDFKPNSSNIMHDTSENGNTFQFSEGDSFVIYVYAIGNVNCEQFELSITDEMYEYFERDCSSGDLYDTSEYTYLGDLVIEETGSYEISSQGDIIIADANEVGTDGLISIASCGCCVLGLILLIIGLATGKRKPQVMMVQPDGTVMAVQGQFVQHGQIISQPQQIVTQPQQYIAQPQETVVEEYSFEQKNDWE